MRRYKMEMAQFDIELIANPATTYLKYIGHIEFPLMLAFSKKIANSPFASDFNENELFRQDKNK